MGPGVAATKQHGVLELDGNLRDELLNAEMFL
jgi:hypothetical protein